MKNTKITEKELFEMFQKVKESEKLRRQLTFLIGENLEAIRKANGHKYLLGEESSFLDILAQPEVFISRDMVYNVSNIIKQLELLNAKENYLDLPLSKLVSIVKVAAILDVDEWLQKARTLGPQDFKDEINEALGKITSLDCEHTFEEYNICKICGRKQHK